jgi:Ca-activated chloride channel family protein
MVETSASGLYTANLGNIKAGEAVTVEIKYAQLLRFEQGRIRLSIPTVIAPRYGDASAVLAPHETADADLSADYPFTLKLDIVGAAANGEIASPSHQIKTEKSGAGVTVTLGDARLDRDFILTLDKLSGHSFAAAAPIALSDGAAPPEKSAEKFAALASFYPDLPQTDAPIYLKILVDCSGSMGGDSIRSAK